MKIVTKRREKEKSERKKEEKRRKIKKKKRGKGVRLPENGILSSFQTLMSSEENVSGRDCR